MLITEIIRKKRDKKELSDSEISFFVKGVTDNTIPDYQISALLMAICLNGMNQREILTLTLEMSKSGDVLDLSDLGPNTVDKHSTGGVGDKTTLIIAPIVASLGCIVAKMSGKGLGHTGGTIDKLDSIPGYKTALNPTDFKAIVKKQGMCIVSQSGNFAPADKHLYSIRDVTGTVESIPLIASSIMSKKLAAGAKTIVLDVKYGSGAFMKTKEAALELATCMVEIGKGAGRKMSALITNMNNPLGNAIGNSIEIKEAIKVLNCKGPKDLTDLCIDLSSEIYSLCYGKTKSESEKSVKRVLSDGTAYSKFINTVKLQGGNIEYLTGEKNFDIPQEKKEIKASSSGFITSLNTEKVGLAACISGAGRQKLGDIIDYSSGIYLYKKYGDYVEKGQILATIYGKRDKLMEASEYLSSAYKYGASAPTHEELVYKIIH